MINSPAFGLPPAAFRHGSNRVLQRGRPSSAAAPKEADMNELSSIQKGTPFRIDDSVAYAIGAVVSKTLLKKSAGNITLFSFDAGQGLSEHTAPYDAVVHILDGEADITIGGETLTVEAGEALIMPANVPHALHAEKRFKMLLIMIRSD
jgi:quercetin dioxygenase-like cupin family protein